jgi:hypothetical protein
MSQVTPATPSVAFAKNARSVPPRTRLGCSVEIWDGSPEAPRRGYNDVTYVLRMYQYTRCLTNSNEAVYIIDNLAATRSK